MSEARHRFTLVEYAKPVALVEQIAAAIKRPKDEVRRLLAQGGRRAALSLGFKRSPISTDESGTLAANVAGLLRLGPSLELEIVPKFLGVGDGGASWREDFFFLATLSRHGRLLASDSLRASGSAQADLSVLVARAMTAMYWDQHRRPLRTYRHVKEADFFIDGDVDPFDLAFPEAGGYQQEVIRLTRNNQHNAVISAAAKTLVPEVSDPRAAAGLLRISSHLGEQRPLSRARSARSRLPSRSRRWQPLVDVASDVVQGLGMSYQLGGASAPGFVLRTWQIWQDLITTASRLAFGAHRVHVESPSTLGSRTKLPSGGVTTLRVYPDVMVSPEATRSFLLDAKYKGHIDKGQLIVSEADVYESMAFAQATQIDTVVLAYPTPASDPLSAVGSTRAFERVNVGSIRIIAIYVEVRGISKRGGLSAFSSRLASDLVDLTT